MTTVFDPAQLGSLSLANRLVMAPLTRSRAQADGTPSHLHPHRHARSTATSGNDG